MQDELRALAKLARMDMAAKGFDEELKSLPARIAEMSADVQTLETLLAQERAQVEEAQALKSARAEEVQERNEALSRAKAKAGRSRTLREADAAEREIEANRRAMTQLREDIAKLEATIEAKSSSLKERESQFEEARAIFATDEAEAKARLAIVTEERGKVTQGREELLATLPKRIAKRYARLRTRETKFLSVAIVENRTCISCQMSLPPQLYIEVQRGEDFHACPQCNALLVHINMAGDPAPTESTADAPVDASSADAPADSPAPEA